MSPGWLARLRARREERIVQRRAIDDELWSATVASLPFLEHRSSSELTALRRLSSLFLNEKEFSGAGGIVVTDPMALCIAVQACLPVLHLGLSMYSGFVGIVVHPDEVIALREVTDDDGVVHTYDEVLSGEAVKGGPLMLSWTDVCEASQTAERAYNVVIHEFAHVIDMADGQADGVPPQANLEVRKQWLNVIGQEFEQFCHQVDQGQEIILDPYGATDIGEFFAVATEAFFVAPSDLQRNHPQLYALLASYFQQDPAAQR